MCTSGGLKLEVITIPKGNKSFVMLPSLINETHTEQLQKFYNNKKRDRVIILSRFNNELIAEAEISNTLYKFRHKKGEYLTFISCFLKENYRKTGIGPVILSEMNKYIEYNEEVLCEGYILNYFSKYLTNAKLIPFYENCENICQPKI